MRLFSKLFAQITLIGFSFCYVIGLDVKNGKEYPDYPTVIENDHEYLECPHWPQLFILGTQKGGTSSLFEALMRHPKSCLANICDNEPQHLSKEVHFFDMKTRYKEGPKFYCSRFSTCNKSKKNRGTKVTNETMLHIDGTPGSLNFRIAQLMANTFSPSSRKNMKFIAVLREPAGRLLSWYNHLTLLSYNNFKGSHIIQHNILDRKTYERKTGYNSGLRKSVSIDQDDTLEKFLSFEEFALTDLESVRKGKYINILKEYFDVFGMENFLILNHDYVFQHQSETMRLISEFLDIDNVWGSNFEFRHINENQFDRKLSIEQVDSQLLKELHSFYQPFNEALYSFLQENKEKFWYGQPEFGRF